MRNTMALLAAFMLGLGILAPFATAGEPLSCDDGPALCLEETRCPATLPGTAGLPDYYGCIVSLIHDVEYCRYLYSDRTECISESAVDFLVCMWLWDAL